MKKIFTENIGLKLISLLLAVVMWLIIIYTYDPADTKEFTLEVEVLNEQAITSLGKVYEIVGTKNVRIRAKGNTSVVSSLKASDFRATADISSLSPTNHAMVNVVCKKTNDVEITFLDSNLIKIALDEKDTKQLKIDVVIKGSTVDGFCVGEKKTTPNLIRVYGAKSVIEKITQVRVEVDVSDMIESFSTDVVPSAYDEQGNLITSGSLTFSKSPITASITIYSTKEVPVEIVAEGSPQPGYKLTAINYEPKTVVVAGSNDKLASVDKITIPYTIGSTWITDMEEEIPLDAYLPEGIFLKNPESSVVVDFQVERMQTKTIEIAYDTIQIRNMLPDLKYRMADEGNMTVRVQGLESDLEALTEVNLRPYVDAGSITDEGTYRLTVYFELEDKYTVLASYSASVLAELPGVNDPETGEEPDSGNGGGAGGNTDTGTDTGNDDGNSDRNEGGDTGGNEDGSEDSNGGDGSNAGDEEPAADEELPVMGNTTDEEQE